MELKLKLFQNPAFRSRGSNSVDGRRRSISRKASSVNAKYADRLMMDGRGAGSCAAPRPLGPKLLEVARSALVASVVIAVVFRITPTNAN